MNLEGLGLQSHQITILNNVLATMTYKEKDLLFDRLDKYLHETTYKDLDDEVDSLRTRLEDLGETVDYYQTEASEYLEGQRAAFAR